AHLLLLAQLHAEVGEPRAALAVLAGRIAAALDSALGGEAAVALQEELRAFATAEPTDCIVVPGHSISSRWANVPLPTLPPPPLLRPTPVGRDRRDVLDQRHLDARRLDRTDGRLAARPGTLHVHGGLAHPVLHRLLRALLRGHLRRERRRLARSLEAGSA